MLKDVKNFIQEIKSMSEKINLSLFKDFFESLSPADYAKMLINTSPDKNKEIVEEIEDWISDLKDRIKKMSEKEKKNADETLNIIEKILDYNKNAQKIFQLASKVDKGKLESKTEESIAEQVKSKIKKEKKKKTICLSTTLLIIKTQVIFIKNYVRQKVKKMKIKYIQSKKC